MGRPKKNPEPTEAVVPAKEKKEKKSFKAFWESYKESICNISEREYIIAEAAATAAWDAK